MKSTTQHNERHTSHSDVYLSPYPVGFDYVTAKIENEMKASNPDYVGNELTKVE